MNIKEAKILITGATSGIGYTTAEVLKEQGAQVFICGRHQEKVDKACQKLGVKGLLADVSKEEDIENLFEEAIKEMNGLNVLINNAGIGGKMNKLVDDRVSNLQSVWEINVRGLFMAGQAAAKHFIQQEYGNIINIGSTAANKGFAGGSSYVASKFAVSGLTQCWQAELRPHNIRVMQVNPSEVITEFIDKVGYTAQNVDKKLKPTEIAHLIVAMLSMNDIGLIPAAEVWATNPW